MNKIKNISCVKCKYHAVTNRHICTKDKCELTGEDVYGLDGEIVRYETWEDIIRRKRLARSKLKVDKIEKQRLERKELKDQKELDQVEKDYGTTFEQVMVLLS